MAHKLIPETTFNSWTLISQQRDIYGIYLGWLCKCVCGNEKIVKNVGTIVNGSSTSCGCVRKSLLSSNNPMYSSETREKVSSAHKNDPNRVEIARKAGLAAKSPRSKEKRKATNNIRYGGNSPANSIEVQEKIKQTNNERYGHDSPANSEQVREKMIDTNMKKYGVENVMHLPHYQELVSKKVTEKIKLKKSKLALSEESLIEEYKENIALDPNTKP